MEEQDLRFADSPTTEAEVVIDAPPDVVWALVSDIALPVRFSTELQSVEWLDGATTAAPGARFAGRSQHAAAGEWETTCVVVQFLPPRVFEWAVGDPDFPAASWRFTLNPEGDRTRLVQWMRIGPGRSGINPAIEAMPDKESKILRYRLREHRANMERTLEGVKALAEG